MDNKEEVASSAIYCVKSNKRLGKVIYEKHGKSSFIAEAMAIIGALQLIERRKKLFT